MKAIVTLDCPNEHRNRLYGYLRLKQWNQIEGISTVFWKECGSDTESMARTTAEYDIAESVNTIEGLTVPFIVLTSDKIPILKTATHSEK